MRFITQLYDRAQTHIKKIHLYKLKREKVKRKDGSYLFLFNLLFCFFSYFFPPITANYLVKQLLTYFILYNYLKQMLTVFFFGLIITLASSINFRLNKNREYCFDMTGSLEYELEYLVSGEGENNVLCKIYDGSNEIDSISYMNQYERTFFLSSSSGKVCFSSLDNHSKVVSFDFFTREDPAEKKNMPESANIVSKKLMEAYHHVEKLYRNQHFYVERSRVHQDLLTDVQLKVTLMIGWKIILVIVCAVVQIFVLKKLIDNRGIGYTAVRMEEKA